jgi:hypothetical protein
MTVIVTLLVSDFSSQLMTPIRLTIAAIRIKIVIAADATTASGYTLGSIAVFRILTPLNITVFLSFKFAPFGC